MRIGELARLTATPPRLLRYYEEQGLLLSARQPNGYRDYETDSVDRVRQIRGLIESGVPTSIIRPLMPCLGPAGDIVLHDNCPEIVGMLENQLHGVTERIESLTRDRDAISHYLDAVRAETTAPSRG